MAKQVANMPKKDSRKGDNSNKVDVEEYLAFVKKFGVRLSEESSNQSPFKKYSLLVGDDYGQQLPNLAARLDRR